MDSMESFLMQYGYLVLFIGTFLEGETILLVAAYLASLGYLDLWTAVGVAATGTFLGDQVYFWVGRRWGKAWVQERRRSWRKRISRVLRLLRRYDTWFILTYRFFYGIRNISSFALGMTRISPLRFLFLNAVASLFWAVSFGLAGFYFGKTVEHFLGTAKEYQIYVLGGLAGAGVLFWLIHRLRSKE